MFTREDTKAVKGIAIILMLLHHLAGFPDRVPVGFEGFSSLWSPFVDRGYLSAIAAASKICVAIFFFLGGYGLYKRLSQGSSVVDIAVSLYRRYWRVFIIFVPIAYIFFSRTGADINPLATHYEITSVKDFITEIISNLSGYSSSINKEWWFFFTYLCLIPLGCLLCMFTEKNNSFLKDIFIVFIIDIFSYNVFPNMANTTLFAGINGNFYFKTFFLLPSQISSFFAGIVFAKYDMLSRIKDKISSLRFKALISLAAMAVVMWGRMFIVGAGADIIYTSVFSVCAAVLFDSVRLLKKPFVFFGKHSANMWYIHTFYCYYFLEATKIVYCTRSVFLDLLILIGMCLISSVLLEFLYKQLDRLGSLGLKERLAARFAKSEP